MDSAETQAATYPWVGPLVACIVTGTVVVAVGSGAYVCHRLRKASRRRRRTR